MEAGAEEFNDVVQFTDFVVRSFRRYALVVDDDALARLVAACPGHYEDYKRQLRCGGASTGASVLNFHGGFAGGGICAAGCVSGEASAIGGSVGGSWAGNSGRSGEGLGGHPGVVSGVGESDGGRPPVGKHSVRNKNRREARRADAARIRELEAQVVKEQARVDAGVLIAERLHLAMVRLRSEVERGEAAAVAGEEVDFGFGESKKKKKKKKKRGGSSERRAWADAGSSDSSVSSLSSSRWVNSRVPRSVVTPSQSVSQVGSAVTSHSGGGCEAVSWRGGRGIRVGGGTLKLSGRLSRPSFEAVVAGIPVGEDGFEE